jgi:hypothetical protein
MKTNVPLKVDGKYGNPQIRLRARDALLNKLKISPGNTQAINAKIRRHITSAKSISSQLREGKDNNNIELMLLQECMIIWLLGSEPASRRRALLLFAVNQGVSPQSNTSFLAMILKLFGYAPEARRKLNRDATGVEFAMTQGMMPSTLIAYFKTAGQGRDATYRRAIGVGPRKHKAHHNTRLSPDVRDRIEKLLPGRGYITLTRRTRAGSTVQSCLFDQRNVKAVVTFIQKHLVKTST